MCFTTVYRKRGMLKGAKERPSVGRPDGLRCPTGGRSACLVSCRPGQRGHREELALCVNNTGCLQLQRDVYNRHCSNANSVIRRWLE